MDNYLLLNAIVTMYRDAILPWGGVIGNIMLPLLGKLMVLGFTLMMIAEVWGMGISIVPALFNFMLLAGFASAMLTFGPEWVLDLFTGIGTISHMLGVPSTNPSALASIGAQVADPIYKSLAAQGALSFMFSPTSWTFQLAGLALQAAFYILAMIQLALLISSYLIVASTGFFCCFMVTPFTRPLTMLWVRLLCGTMAALFMTLLLTACCAELGELLQVHLRTHFLAEGVTLTWPSYAAVIGIAVVLIGLFIYIPVKVGALAHGLVPDWSGGRAAAGLAMSGAGMAWSGAQAVGSAMSGGGSSSGGSGGQGGSGVRALGSGSGGGSLGASPWGTKAQSSWVGKPY